MMTTTELKSSTQGCDTDASAEPAFLAARLSVLIFLAFAVLGAWVPVFTLHLQKLGFTAEATAWASASNAIAALIAPLFWGQIADRWLPMQRCISLCAAATGGGLWLLAELHDPAVVIAACIGVWLFLIPAIGLSTSLIFRQLDHPERGYGPIRMWGTVGWVTASWCLTLWFATLGSIDDYADSLRLGGLAGFALAIYALTLPHTPPQRVAGPPRSWLARLADAPLSTLHLFRDRSFVIYCVCMFGFNITLPFTIQLNPLLLRRLEIDLARLPTYLTINQSTEMLFLFLLPLLLRRFGTKPVMVTGAVSWTLGLSLLSIGEPVWLVLGSFVTAGVFICCFFIAGQVFVNRLATHDIRASAQALLLLISGSGLLLGHLLVGWIRTAAADQYHVAYGIAAALSGTLTMIYAAGFDSAPANSTQESLVPESEMA